MVTIGESLSLSSNVLAISIGVILAILIYYKYKFNYWRKRGINGPPPYLFVGTFLTELLGNSVTMQSKWAQQYGRVFGTYTGTDPLLVVGDANIIKNIMIKDANIFMNRQRVDHGSENTKNMLFFMRDGRWKALRTLLAFTMTSGKIKRYFPLMQESGDELIANISDIAKGKNYNHDNNKDTPNNIMDPKKVYGCYTIDVIARAAFAARLDSAESEQKHRRDLVSVLLENLGKIIWSKIILLIIIPKVILRAFNFTTDNEKMNTKLEKLAEHIIASRRKMGEKGRRDDLLQTLLDLDATNTAIGEHLVECIEGDENESHHVVGADKQEIDQTLQEANQINNGKMVVNNDGDSKDSVIGKKLKLTDSEIIGNCILFLLAGYETTSSMLSHATNALAHHPEAQEKLYEELKQNLTDGKFVYEKIMSLPYLDAVLSETLRLYPPVTNIGRQPTQDYKIESLNLTIPKDSTVFIPISSIHRDPEYYEQPDSFIPERFLPHNRHQLTPYTYLPFGAGIRHCLGMRFALAEGKLALARLVYNFKFSPAPDCPYPPKYGFILNVLRCYNLSVIVTPRN